MRRAWLALLLCVAACAPDFIEPWEVAEPRLMGARVEVEGDPTRPRPRLGERFSLRFFLALPAGMFPTPLADRYGFDVALCLGFKTPNGLLTCLGEQDFSPTVEPISDTEVLVSGLALDSSLLGALDLPPELLEGAAMGAVPIDRLTLFGVFCVDGAPQRVAGKVAGVDDPNDLYTCQPRAGATFPSPTAFTLSVYFDSGAPTDGNRNPSFECDPAAPDSVCNLGPLIDGEARVAGSFVIARPEPDEGAREVVAWPARDPSAPLPWEGCAADPSLVQVRADSGEHTLRARFDPADRETYSFYREVNGTPELRMEREALRLTHAMTLRAGSLSRFESLLDASDPDAEAEISVSYTPPADGSAADTIPENGRLVRFYFTLRDERGGVDFTTRELCLLPAADQE